jgi:hypothetical protein
MLGSQSPGPSLSGAPAGPSPRFGIWALVHGSRAALQDPDEPYDASWVRNRALVQAAEALGFDSVLVAQHTINPHDGEREQLEAWTAAAALAALTERIEIIAAIKPYLYHPVVLAKMALGIEEISEGRFTLNLVNAWNRPELERAGIGAGSAGCAAAGRQQGQHRSEGRDVPDLRQVAARGLQWRHRDRPGRQLRDGGRPHCRLSRGRH